MEGWKGRKWNGREGMKWKEAGGTWWFGDERPRVALRWDPDVLGERLSARAPGTKRYAFPARAAGPGWRSSGGEEEGGERWGKTGVH